MMFRLPLFFLILATLIAGCGDAGPDLPDCATIMQVVVTGEETIAYKTAAIQERQAEGYTYEYAYGNAITDIDAFVAAGIDLSRIFTVGELAGEQGTQAVEGGNFVEHAAEQLPLVPSVCVFR